MHAHVTSINARNSQQKSIELPSQLLLQKVVMRISFNTNALLLLVIILALCGGRCFGTKGRKKPPSAAGRQQPTHDEHGSPYLNFEQPQQKSMPEPLTIYANVEAKKFKQFVQNMTGQPKATPELPGTSDSFQQPESAESWIKDLMSTGAHLKPNSGPSTAPIMPAQNSARLYNSTGRTSMPGQSSAALALPGGGGGGTSTTLQPGQSTWIRKGKAKATSSASFKQPKSGRSSGTNFLAGLQLFPTAHKQSSAALALPGDADGTSTALQPDQSTSNAKSSAALALPGDADGTSTALQPDQSTSNAKSSAALALPGDADGTSAALQPDQSTSNAKSSAALALPGDADGTSTALQPDQSTSNASDAND
uniref:VQ domain-containing protein n=1 Tax=Globodera rostochiensis TaxID=31243 RepID=A0A914H6T6_GLORO